MRQGWALGARDFPGKATLAKVDREAVVGTAVVLFVAVVSIALTLQGWRSRIPAFDLLTYIHGVRHLLENGTLLPHGDTGSYGSFKPPGTVWLMLPSALLFEDPRLSEYTGTALLHVATLICLFLLARRFFGFVTAVLAVLLYGLSEHSIFFAGSLWPNGRPDFYILLVFFTCLWVLRKQARYLAAALAVWGIGMQVDMGITPAIFLLPVAWLIYRPPIRFKPLLMAGLLVLIVWIPYLRFEAPRGFADIRSQLLQQHIIPKDYRASWCDPGLALQQYQINSSASPDEPTQSGMPSGQNTGYGSKVVNFLNEIKDKALSNFQPMAPVPGAGAVLLLLTMSSLVFLSVPGSPAGETGLAPQRPIWRRWYGYTAAGLILAGLALAVFLSAYLSGREITHFGARILLIYKIQKILLISGVALLAGLLIAALTDRILIRRGVHIQTAQQAERSRLLVISLLVPWFLLLVLAEPGKPERFWWLWPMQSLFLAAFFTMILPRLRAPVGLVWVGQVLVVLIIAGNSFLLSRVEAWARTGWAGPEASEIQVVDYIARQVKAGGRQQAAIGYQTFIYPFMANYNILNPIYKVGAEFDLLLLYRHGIVNTDQCAEGVSAADEYRVIETKPKPPDWSPKDYFAVPLNKDFRLGLQSGTYLVFQRGDLNVAGEAAK